MHAEDSPALVEMKKHNSRAMSVPNWVAEYANETMYYLNVVDNMGWLKGTMPPLEFPVDESGPTLEAPAVALCNGTFDKKMRNGKQWPHFAELARVLKLLRPDVRIVKVGFGDELRAVAADVDVVGKLSITQTAKVLRQCSLVVTVDTALMHVADALGIPTIAIFGGSLVSKNGPINANVRVVRKGLSCQPCQGNGAEFCNCAHANCLAHLSVGEVMQHVRTILS